MAASPRGVSPAERVRRKSGAEGLRYVTAWVHGGAARNMEKQPGGALLGIAHGLDACMRALNMPSDGFFLKTAET